jgi:hypothetical protein
MPRLIITALAGIVLLSTITNMLRSHMSMTIGLSGAAPAVQQQSAVDTATLPVEDFEDRSLVYPRLPKR